MKFHCTKLQLFIQELEDFYANMKHAEIVLWSEILFKKISQLYQCTLCSSWCTLCSCSHCYCFWQEFPRIPLCSILHADRVRCSVLEDSHTSVYVSYYTKPLHYSFWRWRVSSRAVTGPSPGSAQHQVRSHSVEYLFISKLGIPEAPQFLIWISRNET